MERAVEGGAERTPPEPVLDEPQHRVRNDVVEAVVGDRVDCDERALGAAFVGDGTVFLRHRTRDPRDVVPVEQSAERGDEAAAAALLHAPATDAVVRDRPAVRDDDQPQATGGA